MGLVYTVAPPSTALVSAALVKEELGLDGTTHDAYLQRLIRRVSDAIVSYCGRPFAQGTVRESFVGTGSARLLLSLTPVLALVTDGTTLEGAIVSDATIEDAEAGFLIRASGAWPATRERRAPLSGDTIPGSGEQAILVDYVGGYTLPTFPALTGPPTLPPELEDLAVAMVCARYHRRGGDQNVTQERIGDWSASYGKTLADEMHATLARWRRAV